MVGNKHLAVLNAEDRLIVNFPELAHKAALGAYDCWKLSRG
jgi:hypothetical protein